MPEKPSFPCRVVEYAAYHRVSRRAVLNWIKAGLVIAQKVGYGKTSRWEIEKEAERAAPFLNRAAQAPEPLRLVNPGNILWSEYQVKDDETADLLKDALPTLYRRHFDND